MDLEAIQNTLFISVLNSIESHHNFNTFKQFNFIYKEYVSMMSIMVKRGAFTIDQLREQLFKLDEIFKTKNKEIIDSFCNDVLKNLENIGSST